MLRKMISIILALIFLAIGLIPVLNNFGVIGFSIPAMPGLILWILAIVGGVWLIIDSFKESQSFHKGIMAVSILVALIVLAFGLIPLLNQFGVIGFSMPSFVQTIGDFIFILGGLFLLIGGFMGWDF